MRSLAIYFFVSLFLILLLPDSATTSGRTDLARLLQILPQDGAPERYGEVVFEKHGDNSRMPPAVFPHWLHRSKYTCNVCHTDLGFSLRRGETRISRADYLAGRYCGACHDGATAFSGKFEAGGKHCRRCHPEDRKALDDHFRAFAEEMPAADYGNKIDWVKALADGLIIPKRSFYEDEASFELPGKLRKPLNLKASSARSLTPFPHSRHAAWIDCSGCHPEIFNIEKAGTEFFSMDKNLYGWFCGTCHTRVAFSMWDCGRCHPYIKSGRTGPKF